MVNFPFSFSDFVLLVGAYILTCSSLLAPCSSPCSTHHLSLPPHIALCLRSTNASLAHRTIPPTRSSSAFPATLAFQIRDLERAHLRSDRHRDRHRELFRLRRHHLQPRRYPPLRRLTRSPLCPSPSRTNKDPVADLHWQRRPTTWLPCPWQRCIPPRCCACRRAEIGISR
jgi:hypothetical protein